jgi:isochorismate synthase
MGVALWRLPGQSDKHLVFDTSGGLKIGKIDLEETTGGFLVAPFDNPDRLNEIFLRAQIYLNSRDRQLRTAAEVNSSDVDHLINQLRSDLSFEKTKPSFYYKNNDVKSSVDTDYISTVENALDAIGKGVLQKVVPAVSRKVALEKDFSCLETFEKLCASYPTAFVSLITAPEIGTWMGASPESIIEVDKSKIFTTVAVAGTQKHQKKLSLQDVPWKQKEIEEQALVSRYIINCFKKIRLREFEEMGPKTVVAGNLLHLKTTYTVDMQETNFPQLGSVMLDLLHPTSAVCGMPKTRSQEFLKKQESFQRELFSGYLGPVNMNDETHLFVNLRCMQIQPQHAILYAGAGVTEDSIPEKEWIETQLKCDTLLDVLKN